MPPNMAMHGSPAKYGDPRLAPYGNAWLPPFQIRQVLEEPHTAPTKHGPSMDRRGGGVELMPLQESDDYGDTSEVTICPPDPDPNPNP